MQSSINTHASSAPQVFVYQVEFNAIATGKIIAMSKRRMRWRYGFPNQESIDAGKSGTECRGEEHDVTFVWSISSGKRMIMSNGKQLFIGINKSNIFEHHWIDSRGNAIHLIAHATQPVSSSLGTRQYELLVNGKSFFNLPKSYEIGLKGPSDSRVPGVISSVGRQSAAMQAPKRSIVTYSDSGRNLIRSPQSEEEEMTDLKKAIEASLRESKEHLSRKGLLNEDESAKLATPASANSPPAPQEVQAPKSEELLIDFFSDPTPSATIPPPTQTQNSLVLLNATPQQHQVDPFGYNNESALKSVDEFAPRGPTYDDISSQILLNYSVQQPAAQPQQYPPQSIASSVTPSNPFDEPSHDHSTVISDLSSLHIQQHNTHDVNSVTPTQQYQQHGLNSVSSTQQHQQHDFNSVNPTQQYQQHYRQQMP